MKYLYLLIVAALVGAISLASPPRIEAQQSVVVPATMASTPVGGGIAAAVKLVSGISGKSIYITGIALAPVATAKVVFTTGTGTTPCATGTSTPTGIMTFATGQSLVQGSGNGAILVVPQGDDFCITVTAAAAPGYLTFSQF